jgi:hypothetical protein
MRTDKVLSKVMREVLRELYLSSDPPLDLDKVEEGKKEDCLEYYLPEEKEEEIVERIYKKHRVTKAERKRMSFTLFNYAPSNVRREKE